MSSNYTPSLSNYTPPEALRQSNNPVDDLQQQAEDHMRRDPDRHGDHFLLWLELQKLKADSHRAVKRAIEARIFGEVTA